MTRAASDPVAAPSWTALGTTVELRVPQALAADAVHRSRAVLAEVDAACSRFRPDSDLNIVNARAGRAVRVSPVLVAAVRVALEAARETNGMVDPTLGVLLATAGYDRTFDLVPGRQHGAADVPVHRARWQDIDVTDETVCIPEAGLDLGATGKAFAADLLALTLAAEFGAPVLVSIGGDVRVVAGGEPTAYNITIDHTLAAAAQSAAEGVRHLTLHDGGLATSSSAARRWQRGGRAWHHVLDPRTGSPAAGPWRTVTALGHTAAAANTASTAALVLGADAVPWLTERGVAARLVGHDDRVVTTADWPAGPITEGAS